MEDAIASVIGCYIASKIRAFYDYLTLQRNPVSQILYWTLMVCCYWYTHFYLVDHLVPSYFLTDVHKVYLMCIVFMCYASNIYLVSITPKTCEQVLKGVKEPAKKDYDEVMYESGKKCPTCNILKLPRSKHCSVCDVCVADFDHHCYWTNGCITRTNYLPFLFFCCVHALFALYGFSLWFLSVLGNVFEKQ